MTLEKLMEEIGCKKWPDVWQNLYPIATEKLRNHEYICLTEDYYDYLQKEYSIFDTYPFIDVFKKAAKKTADDEKASIFLALIVETLSDRENIYKNLEALEYPEDSENFVYAMLRGLAFMSMADYTADVLKSRGIPEEVILKILRNFPNGVDTHRKCYNGKDGFMDFNWNQRMIDGNLIPIKRLVAEVQSKFAPNACVFVNDEGKAVTLADGIKLHKSGFVFGVTGYKDEEGSWLANICETEESYIGYAYNSKAIVDPTPVTLPKNKWKKIVSKGDNVIDLHIPGGGGLTPELVDESLAEIKEFISGHYPEYNYEVFQCWSWLCDPQLIEILGEDTNISKFTARFTPIRVPDDSMPVFRFVFNIPHTGFKIEDLPENTTLERKLKNHFLSGKHIYGTAGYFLKGDVK